MKNGFHILPASRACRNFLACMHYIAFGLAAPAGAIPPASPAPVLEHQEFDAMLEAAFQPNLAGGNRTFIVHFTLPGAQSVRNMDWRLGLYRPDGRLVRQWRGRHALHCGSGETTVNWRASPALPAGIYMLHLRTGNIRQSRPIAVGRPATIVPAAAALDSQLGAGAASHDSPGRGGPRLPAWCRRPAGAAPGWPRFRHRVRQPAQPDQPQ